MEDAGTSEEDDIDSQDSNTSIDHGHLAQNCSFFNSVTNFIVNSLKDKNNRKLGYYHLIFLKNTSDCFYLQISHTLFERGDAVVTRWSRMWEVLISNSGADQLDWYFFVVSLSHQGKIPVWIFIIRLTIHKIHQTHKSVNLTKTHRLHNNRNTKLTGRHTIIIDAI